MAKPTLNVTNAQWKFLNELVEDDGIMNFLKESKDLPESFDLQNFIEVFFQDLNCTDFCKHFSMLFADALNLATETAVDVYDNNAERMLSYVSYDPFNG